MFKRFLAFIAVLILSIPCVRAAKAPAAPPPPPAEPMKIDLPPGAIAFHFGGRPFDGFKKVLADTKYADDSGFGFTKGDHLSNTGNSAGWPTTYHLAMVYPDAPGEYQFKAKVPNGKYLVHLAYGPILRYDAIDTEQLLKVNDWSIFDDKPSPEDYSSEKYLFRFMNTQYSEKPDAIWNNYLSKMYPVQTHEINVTDGFVTLDAANEMLFGMILVPAENKTQFDDMTKKIERQMLDSYHSNRYYFIAPQTKPVRAPNDPDYYLYVPSLAETIMPSTGATAEERAVTSLDLAGVPGQRVAAQIAVVPFVDLGQSTLELADLKGDAGVIPASQIKGHFKNYRYAGLNPAGFQRDDTHARLTEMALMPTLTLEMEKGITQNYWLWLQIPPDAKPGIYKAQFNFKPANGKPTPVPIQVEVYPFKLKTDLPLSLGMYGVGIDPPMVTPEVRRHLMRQRMDFLRSLGMTGITIGVPRITKAADGSLKMNFDPTSLQVAKEAGMGAIPEQMSMIENLFLLGRYTGFWMPGSPGAKEIDAKPGSELKIPDFNTYFLKNLAEFKKMIDPIGLPIAANIVDEPREKNINPWNRDFDDTSTYIKLVRDAGGWKIAENPMYDVDRYTHKDYTSFVDEVDIISTHAWKPSSKLMTDAVKKGKILWIYNVGMDRYTWGFFNWKAQSKGRWEWHFCFPEDSFREFKGAEWYNPFEIGTETYGVAAPYSKYPGGMLYQSAFLTASEGITDTAYLYTLDEAIKENKAANKNADVVAKAEQALQTIRSQIPDEPTQRNLMTGAEVGHAESDVAARSTDQWRKQIAEYLKVLAK